MHLCLLLHANEDPVDNIPDPPADTETQNPPNDEPTVAEAPPEQSALKPPVNNPETVAGDEPKVLAVSTTTTPSTLPPTPQTNLITSPYETSVAEEIPQVAGATTTKAPKTEANATTATNTTMIDSQKTPWFWALLITSLFCLAIAFWKVKKPIQ